MNINKSVIGLIVLQSFFIPLVFGAIEISYLNVSEDVTIDSRFADENFATLPELIAASIAESADRRIIYLKFDASALPPISQIETIEAYAMPLRRPRGVEVYLKYAREGTPQWTETAITWKNAPLNDLSLHRLSENEILHLGSFSPLEPHTVGTVQLEWANETVLPTKLRDALNSGNRVVTLILVRPTDRFAAYASRENTAPAAHPIRIRLTH